MPRIVSTRHQLTAVTVALVLLLPQAAVADASEGDHRKSAKVVVTRAEGFAWREVLLGVGIGAALVTAVSALTLARRRDPTHHQEASP